MPVSFSFYFHVISANVDLTESFCFTGTTNAENKVKKKKTIVNERPTSLLQTLLIWLSSASADKNSVPKDLEFHLKLPVELDNV